MKILVCANSLFNLTNFRRSLLEFMVDRGCVITALAFKQIDDEKFWEILTTLGIEVITIGDNSKDKIVRNHIAYLRTTWQLLKSHRSNGFCLTFTPKISILVGMLCVVVQCRSIVTVSGLGSVFLGSNYLRSVLLFAFKIIGTGSSYFVFHNEADRDLFIKHKICRTSRSVVVWGSGIDKAKFRPSCRLHYSGAWDEVRFGFCGRFLGDKGLYEFIEAGKILWEERVTFTIFLIGGVDPGNPSSITEKELSAWRKLPYVEVIPWLGKKQEIGNMIDCLVQPSYREGMSRSILEAMSMRLPVICSDVPGCRELVDDGISGVLFEPRSVEGIVNAMKLVCSLSRVELQQMGACSYDLVDSRYSDANQVDTYWALLSHNGESLT